MKYGRHKNVARGTTASDGSSETYSSGLHSISADGHTVAFHSYATNLTGQTDLNGSALDIFVYDTVAKTTTNITNGGNSYSYSPSVSADGHTVAFYSTATNLTGQTDLNGSITDVFVYDTVAKTTTNITNGGNSDSYSPSVSADGSSVVFDTYATNLDGGTHPTLYQEIALWHI